MKYIILILSFIPLFLFAQEPVTDEGTRITTTAGSVIFSDGSTLVQDNAEFFYEAANRRLAIGMNAPVNMLTLRLQEGMDEGVNTGISMFNNFNNSSGGEFLFYKRRTQAGGPVQAGDILGDIHFKASYTGVTYQTAAQIRAGIYSSGTINNTPRTPSYLSFWTAPDTDVGAMAERARIDHRGYLGINTTVPNARMAVLGNSLGVTQDTTAGFMLQNYTPAALGAQQISPMFILGGSGWGTTGSAAQTVRFGFDILPVQGTVPSATLRIGSSINNAAFVNRMTITSGGAVTADNFLAAVASGFGSSGGEFALASATDVNSLAVIRLSYSINGTAQPGGIMLQRSQTNTVTSGNTHIAQIYGTFAPTSGTATNTGLHIFPVINQTGGANGITRGLYINPTLTAAADYRAIDVARGRSVFAGRLEAGMGANVASANDLTLGADGNVFHITGATQINAITTSAWQAGSEITLIFDSTPTVKNNTAGGAGTAVMLLAGGADFSATANDVLKLVYDGASWLEVSRSIN